MDRRTLATSGIVLTVWLLLHLCRQTFSASPLVLHAALAALFVGATFAIPGQKARTHLGKPQGRLGYRLTLGYFIVTCLAYMALKPDQWQWSLQEHFSQSLLAPEVAVLFTLVPFYEEFFFRGAIQSWMISRFQPRNPQAVSWGIYITALLFWLFHAPLSPQAWIEALRQGAVPVSPGPFLLGILCGFIAVRDKSIVFAAAFHGVANLLGPLWAGLLPPAVASLFFAQ